MLPGGKTCNNIPVHPHGTDRQEGRTRPEEFYEEVYSIVRQIPPGRVLTYGAIARMMGRPRHARLVGEPCGALRPGRGIPCHRVVNSRGGTAPGMGPDSGICSKTKGCLSIGTAASCWNAACGSRTENRPTNDAT